MKGINVVQLITGIPGYFCSFFVASRSFHLMDTKLGEEINTLLLMCGVGFAMVAGFIMYYTVEAVLALLGKE